MVVRNWKAVRKASMPTRLPAFNWSAGLVSLFRWSDVLEGCLPINPVNANEPEIQNPPLVYKFRWMWKRRSPAIPSNQEMSHRTVLWATKSRLHRRHHRHVESAGHHHDGRVQTTSRRRLEGCCHVGQPGKRSERSCIAATWISISDARLEVEGSARWIRVHGG